MAMYRGWDWTEASHHMVLYCTSIHVRERVAPETMRTRAYIFPNHLKIIRTLSAKGKYINESATHNIVSLHFHIRLE